MNIFDILKKMEWEISLLSEKDLQGELNDEEYSHYKKLRQEYFRHLKKIILDLSLIVKTKNGDKVKQVKFSQTKD